MAIDMATITPNSKFVIIGTLIVTFIIGSALLVPDRPLWVFKYVLGGMGYLMGLLTIYSGTLTISPFMIIFGALIMLGTHKMLKYLFPEGDLI